LTAASLEAAARYPDYLHPLTAPEHLCAVGRILGLATADPTGASVLELGCGAGANLMTMAQRSCGGRFLGVDLSEAAIDSARAVARDAGLANVQFVAADLAGWRCEETFDYIVVHGVFSWVPDAVKEAIFRILAAGLKATGIAYVSYAVYPGYKIADSLRDFVRLRVEGLDEAGSLASAHNLLGLLSRAWKALEPAPFAGAWREAADRIDAKEPQLLLQDDLGPVRDPCYLLQFVAWAGEHGLRHLGDSELAAGGLETLPGAVANEIRAQRLAPLEAEQLVDYVVNRSFRRSLLVSSHAVIDEPSAAEALRGACLRPILRPRPDREGEFTTEKGHPVAIADTTLAQLLRLLAERWGACTPLDSLVEALISAYGAALERQAQDRLLGQILELHRRRQIGLWVGASALPAASGSALNRLNRVFAARRGMLATATHERIALTPAQRDLCGFLDGRHDLDALAATPPGRALGDRLPGFLERLSALGCLQA
jgi:SAM-dependent methyltransferase